MNEEFLSLASTEFEMCASQCSFIDSSTASWHLSKDKEGRTGFFDGRFLVELIKWNVCNDLMSSSDSG